MLTSFFGGECSEDWEVRYVEAREHFNPCSTTFEIHIPTVAPRIQRNISRMNGSVGVRNMNRMKEDYGVTPCHRHADAPERTEEGYLGSTLRPEGIFAETEVACIVSSVHSWQKLLNVAA